MRLDTQGYQIAGWIGAAALGVSIVVAAVMSKWWGAAELAATLGLAVAFLLWRRRLPSLFSLLFVTAALLNALGWVFDLWRRVPLYDESVHVYTTFTVSLALAFLAFYSVRVGFREHGMLFVISVASLGLAAGALWEIFEWSIGIRQALQEVIADLIADLIGATIAGFFAVYALRHAPKDQLRD